MEETVDYYVEQLIRDRSILSFELCYRHIYALTSKCDESLMKQLYQKWLVKIQESSTSKEIIDAFNDIFMYPRHKYHLECAQIRQ